MPMLRNLNQFLAALIDTLKAVGRGKIWGVLFLYFLIVAFVLYAHYNFLSPLFYGLVRATTSLASGDAADSFYHYPGHFLYLPWIFGWAKLIVGVLLEGVFLGTAALLFYRWYTRNTARAVQTQGSIWSLWPNLFMVSLIFNGLVTGLSLVMPYVMRDFLKGSPRREVAFELGIMPVLYMFLTALFFLAIPAVAIYRRPFYAAIGRSLRFFAHRPFSAFFMSFIVLLLPILLSAAANHPDTIIEKFRPELVFWVLFLGLVADLIGNFLWMGTAARFLLDEEE